MDEKVDKSYQQVIKAQAFNVLQSLSDFWATMGLETGVPFKDLYKEISDDESKTGEQMRENFLQTKDKRDWEGHILSDEAKGNMALLSIIQVACAYAVQALKTTNDEMRAWDHMCNAIFWHGLLQGTIFGRGPAPDNLNFAKLGSDAVHKENRTMKREVFDWCDDNMINFKSMDSAAESIAGRLVPVKFRTARSWIAEWKKLQSAGRK